MTQLLSFLQELLQRIKTANPPFFKKLQILFSILALVSGFGIVLEWNISTLNWLFDWTWFGFFAGSVVASQLPNANPTPVKTSDDDGGDRPPVPPIKP